MSVGARNLSESVTLRFGIDDLVGNPTPVGGTGVLGLVGNPGDAPVDRLPIDESHSVRLRRAGEDVHLTAMRHPRSDSELAEPVFVGIAAGEDAYWVNIVPSE